MVTYNKNRDKIPEDLKTKTDWKELGYKLIKDAQPAAFLQYQYIYTWHWTDLYNRDQVVPIKRRGTPDVSGIPLTDPNIAEALYNINKSAKKHRDTKAESYSCRNHGQVKRSKNNELKLYGLKDKVISKLVREGRIEVLGYHTQTTTFTRYERVYDPFDNDYDDDYDRDYRGYREPKYKEVQEVKTSYLLLYRLGSYTFHVPTTEEVVKAKNLSALGDIDKISATKGKTTLTYSQSVEILHVYLQHDDPVPQDEHLLLVS